MLLTRFPDDVTGCPVLVLGAGTSGIAAARLLCRKGADVSLVAPGGCRAPECAELKEKFPESFQLLSVPLEDGVSRWLEEIKVSGNREGCFAVASPGIALSEPLFDRLEVEKIPVTGELALGAAFFSGRMIAVTGSKGKSSLVKFLADTLTLAGFTARPCGNYGEALCTLCLSPEPLDFAVVECSSFQLETVTPEFAPEAALILNLSRDHLNRHHTMACYRMAKMRIFSSLLSGHATASTLKCYLPVAEEDPYRLREIFSGCYPEAPDPVSFGGTSTAAWRSSGSVVLGTGGKRVSIAGSYFDNPVLLPAAAAACALLDGLGIPETVMARSFACFTALPHRMERVACTHGVAWVDNSKATSLEALRASLQMASRPILLLAGGRLKEALAETAIDFLSSGVQKVYTYGECGADMAAHWAGSVPVQNVATLAEAMDEAFAWIQDWREGSVLLAPGCASFDQFSGYGERGDFFAARARLY